MRRPRAAEEGGAVVTVRLPHSLSELAQIALDDLTTEVPARGLRVGMSTWCRKRGDGTCSVCAAGAVMVARLGLDPAKGETGGHGWLIRDFGEHNALALVAIDSLRQGRVEVAERTLRERSFVPWMNDEPFDEDGNGEEDPHELSRLIATEYGDEWIKDMRQLVTDLRKAGL